MPPEEFDALHKFAVHYPVEDEAGRLNLGQGNVVEDLVFLSFVGQEVLAQLVLELNIVREIYHYDLEEPSGEL
jgi:hypothetical protein